MVKVGKAKLAAGGGGWRRVAPLACLGVCWQPAVLMLPAGPVLWCVPS